MNPRSALRLAVFLLLCRVLGRAGCRSAPEHRDEAVRAMIEASAQWQRPSCRWLKHGAWVVAYPSESKLYHAARDMRFIEPEESSAHT